MAAKQYNDWQLLSQSDRKTLGNDLKRIQERLEIVPTDDPHYPALKKAWDDGWEFIMAYDEKREVSGHDIDVWMSEMQFVMKATKPYLQIEGA